LEQTKDPNFTFVAAETKRLRIMLPSSLAENTQGDQGKSAYKIYYLSSALGKGGAEACGFKRAHGEGIR